MTPLASRLASRRVVTAPRCCVASCAGIGIVSQGLSKPCISELSVLPQSEASIGGEAERCKKMVFPAAIREKSQCWVALSYDAHSVSAGLGRIKLLNYFLGSNKSNINQTSIKGSCASGRLANRTSCEHFETFTILRGKLSSGSFACSHPLRLQQLIHTPHHWFYSSRRIQCEAMHPPPSSSLLLEGYLNQAAGMERLQPFAEHAITAHIRTRSCCNCGAH